ncbi:PREDICTED: uncharacterized protein LOC104590597 [Nelumbo nucifera]|uniref:Uncharacterized protein LOC104590597 n=1 Tax=Nelumbo nucifera TaxID=4432 RepID=A0A1U7Z5M0_NELNU|nr:PREDICTED: uncharacterized protein LOC104590597 [Nelumbo nucifera]
MAENSQQFGARTDGAIRRVNEGSSQSELWKSRWAIEIPASSFQQTTSNSSTYPKPKSSLKFSKLEAQNSGKLPSQTVVNPKESASAMVLRSGKELQPQPTSPKKVDEEQKEEEEQDPPESSNKVKPDSPLPKISNAIVPPFPSRLEKSKKEEYEQEVLETFRKVEINIPLLDAIKQIPKYAKFLKELCTNKRKLRGDEKVRVGENVLVVIKRTLPERCADPGMFTLPCVIGKKRIEHAMLDLGASINVMPYSIYCALNLGPLKETRVVIQLADRSNAYPEGIVEDVLVQVNDLIFPAKS